MASERFTRQLRVITDAGKSTNSSTRTLSEMIFLSPRHSRVTPRASRFDMDIEVPSSFHGVTIDVIGVGSPKSLEPEMEPIEEGKSVCEVIDALFEIHTALKTRHLGKRTAASALANSNLVSMAAFSSTPVPRDEQLETLANARCMLECAICSEVFTTATETTCCGTIYCLNCIDRWVHERSSCPLCREALGVDMFKNARHAQRMANEMTITCHFCDESMKKANLEKHWTVCEKAPSDPDPKLPFQIRRTRLEVAKGSFESFTDFLLSAAPREAEMTKCYIRGKSGKYDLFTEEGNVLICTAYRKRAMDMSATFILQVPHKALDNSDAVANTNLSIGRLERNFMGSQYTILSTPGGTKKEVGAVVFAATFGKTPREMRACIPSDQGERAPLSAAPSMLNEIENPTAQSVAFVNKPPVWVPSLQAYCLDFAGRVAAASVKNFILSAPDDMEKTTMLFGRTSDRSQYSMDFQYPLSPMTAFAIALSSLDSHLVTFD